MASQLDPVAHDQAMEHLKKANEVRYARADFRRQLKRGEVTFLEILRSTPDALKGVPIGDLLTWTPRTGKTRARTIAKDLSHRRLGDLTLRQRMEIGQRLPERLR